MVIQHPDSPAIISTRGFSKTFSGRIVLKDVDLDIAPGEIHGLVGQNGSGKSTFVKILSGYHAPDPGATLRVRGKPVSLPLEPGNLVQLGMAFVHQNLGLFKAGTVLENLRVGNYDTDFAWHISWRHEREEARQALRRFGVDIDPDVVLGSLDEVHQTLVAVIRALQMVDKGYRGLLVLDEPTARLPQEDVNRLFELLRQATKQEFGVLFVSHRLEEIQEITDRVTVLRDGQVVTTASTQSLSQDDLIIAILGFSLGELYPEPHEAKADVALSVMHASGGGVHDLSISLHKGEIVGLTGLLGMGHERVPYLLFGTEPATSGKMEIGQRQFHLTKLTPNQAIKEGLALVPEDRLGAGAVGRATAAENITLPKLADYFSNGVLRYYREKESVLDLMKRFQVEPASPEREFATFSGGNQQKAILAKWFATEPNVLLLHEPTHGVDVGAKRQIFSHIRNAAEAGKAILISSVEYEDLANICDRVLVFRHGRVLSELRGRSLTKDRILEQCFRRDDARLNDSAVT